ncbi:MAG: hypothetical protein MJ252_09720 [archaeon]|nr:hypothetical protein [archaeon]
MIENNISEDVDKFKNDGIKVRSSAINLNLNNKLSFLRTVFLSIFTIVICFFGLGIIFWIIPYNSYEKMKNQRTPIIMKEFEMHEIIDGNFTTEIPICYATDNAYLYPTLVSMTSACENALPTTKISFYVMVQFDFTSINEEILKSVDYMYPNCEVKIINMGRAFSKAYISGKVKTPTYYRLMAPSLFPNISKMIYLDGDTLIFEDLTPMYEIDMKGLYFRGLLDNNREIEYYGIKPEVYICAGVILMNLDLLREDKVEEKFLKFINEHQIIRFHDQTVLNYISMGKLDSLPARYGLYTYTNNGPIYAFYNNFPEGYKKYTIEELIDAWE